MQVDKQTSYSNTYSYNHSSKIKCKRVGKRNANTDNMPMCYRRRNRRTRQKSLSAALQAVIDPLDNQLGYMGKQETLQA